MDHHVCEWDASLFFLVQLFEETVFPELAESCRRLLLVDSKTENLKLSLCTVLSVL